MKNLMLCILLVVVCLLPSVASAQLQQSGGGGSSISSLTLGGNAVTALATGELNTNVARVGGAAADIGNGTAGSGTLRVAIASNNTAFPVNATLSAETTKVIGTVNQGGTWTVQPGNTANTTAWLVTGTGGTFPATQSGTWNVGLSAGTNMVGSVVPANTCGTTAYDSGLTENVATGAGTDLTSTATCVDALYLTNTSGSAVNVTLKDKSGTPKSYMTTFSLPANSNLILPLRRMKFTGGITVVSGTSSTINAQVVGYQ